jgi:hypothetical protein
VPDFLETALLEMGRYGTEDINLFDDLQQLPYLDLHHLGQKKGIRKPNPPQ